MITIYTEEKKEEIQSTLSTIEGLTESVQIKSLKEIDENGLYLIIDSDFIKVPLPWEGMEPPIVFGSIPFDTDDLLAVVLSKLGYEEEALGFCRSDSLSETLKYRFQLRNFEQPVLDPSSNEEDYYSLHNHAILVHYVGHLHNGVPAEHLFEQAIAVAPSDEHAAFSARHLSVLLLDKGQNQEAELLLRKHYENTLSEKAKRYLELDLINVLLSDQLFSLKESDLTELKNMIWSSIKYFEEEKIQWATASLYSSASEVTNVEKSYTESLGYISKAISIYEDEDLPEFLASAYLRKGTLLYTWAQDANPQFYQSAIDTYQEALKTFTREEFPPVFAEIHHNLAVIYAEMPVEDKKKTMWSAFSATSFKECLDFYQKETYPYEYAMVANNYANALLKYPPAKTGDNSEKAVYYYLEALEIRDAQQFPTERAHTILNYLEACWRVHNINKTMERARYKDMLAKAREIKALTKDQELLAQAQEHLDQLSGLGLAIMKD